MAELALTIPFSIDPYGNVTTTTDQSKIWADRVRFVIGTNLRERILDPEFGTLVPSVFMETADVANTTLESEIEQAFQSQLELLDFNSVETSYDEYTNTTNVSIVYGLPNGEITNTVVAVSFISGNNISVEENI